MTKEQAGQIIYQLGGNRFIAMTGAKNFTVSSRENCAGFQIGRNPAGVNWLKIYLNAWDTYDIEFLKMTKNDIKLVQKVENVYHDQLQSIFTEVTGMLTHL